MSFSMKYYANIFYLLWFTAGLHQYLIAAINLDIISDYDWGRLGIRSHPLTCDDEILQIVCFNKCGMSYMCEKNRCKCSKKEKEQGEESLESLEKALKPIRPVTTQAVSKSFEDTEPYFNPYLDIKQHLFQPNDVKDYDESPTAALRTAVETEEYRLAERPALRHHIAHFCPNLNVARKCIRNCMKLGKPAFCGKDHVCYCGHRYNNNDQEEPLNVNDIYAEFRDLYSKYFGPQDEK